MEKTKTKSKIEIRDICYIAIFTAIIAVMAQISIPLPGGVPLTLQTLAVPLAGIILGAKRGTMSTIIYILLAMAGVPVLAGFSGGAGVVFGVTGGFIISLNKGKLLVLLMCILAMLLVASASASDLNDTTVAENDDSLDDGLFAKVA